MKEVNITFKLFLRFLSSMNVEIQTSSFKKTISSEYMWKEESILLRRFCEIFFSVFFTNHLKQAKNVNTFK